MRDSARTKNPTSSQAFDSDQQRVLDHRKGCLLALGGPGTGKSTALEERYVRLALAEGCGPDRILFLVSNRGQKIAVQDRITRRLLFDEGMEALIEVPVYTWHGLAHHLVSRHYERLEYPEPPVLLTSPEQWGDVRDALATEAEVNWPHYKSMLRSESFVDEVVDFCIRAEQRVLQEAELRRLTEARPEYNEIIGFYRRHRNRLRVGARIDYPTLLEDATSLIADHDDVRAGLHGRFTHVIVDDAQELARVQQRLLLFLAGAGVGGSDVAGRSLVVAADPDSSIEAFRGAEPEWLGRFEADFGAHEQVSLGTSYRLGSDLGGRANEFIERTGESTHRPKSFAGAAGVEAWSFAGLAAEADGVARALRLAHLKDGVRYEDMAVLMTSPASMLPPLERALGAVEVPYSISVPDRSLDREPAVRAFRRLAEFALERKPEALLDVLRSSLIGLEDPEVRALERRARLEGQTLADLIEGRPPGVPAGVATRLDELSELSQILKTRRDDDAEEAFWAVWRTASHYRALREDAGSSGGDVERELESLAVFARALGRFVERRRGSGTLGEYLESIGRADFGADPWLPPSRRRGGVELLSFHASKGRQWSLVVVCGCVEGLIPKGRRARGLFDPYFLDQLSSVERVLKNEAEDRRVFYVATTRARDRCVITTSPGASRRGQPSRFINELMGQAASSQPDAERGPLTLSEAAARMRRSLADVAAPAAERLAALGGLQRICKADPECAAAQPRGWWWRWGWTEGTAAIRAQSGGEELPPDKLRTSYSRISKYDNCGLAYLCSVVLGLDPDSSHNMAFGSWIHQTFEDAEKEPAPEQRAGGRRRLTNGAMMAERFHELFDESVFPNLAIARQFRRDGLVLLQRYEKHMKPGKALMSEHRFNVDFDGHRIRGRIDRVDKLGNKLVVYDYKTSRSPIYASEAKDSLQLAIYCLAATTDPEIAQHGEPASMQLVYPAQVSRGDVARRCQKPEEAELVLERLPGLLRGVLEEDFRPSPEADCRWCKFKPLCPLWPEGRELPR